MMMLRGRDAQVAPRRIVCTAKIGHAVPCCQLWRNRFRSWPKDWQPAHEPAGSARGGDRHIAVMYVAYTGLSGAFGRTCSQPFSEGNSMRKIARTLTAGISIAAIAAPAFAQDVKQVEDSYFKQAQTEMQAIMALQPNTGKAKNVILFVGDGMSIPT